MTVDTPTAPAATAVQPAPVPNDQPSIPDLVRADLLKWSHLGAHRHGVRARIAERADDGLLKYGTKLQPHNGRDAVRDLEEEILDGCQYARQVLFEMEAADPTDPELPRLRGMYDDLLGMACALREIRANQEVRRP